MCHSREGGNPALLTGMPINNLLDACLRRHDEICFFDLMSAFSEESLFIYDNSVNGTFPLSKWDSSAFDAAASCAERSERRNGWGKPPDMGVPEPWAFAARDGCSRRGQGMNVAGILDSPLR